jgi:hypothetical protein
MTDPGPLGLLSKNIDWEDCPDDLWSHGSQYITSRGYEVNLDIDSLMILLWRMDQRITQLETAISACNCDKTSTSAYK